MDLPLPDFFSKIRQLDLEIFKELDFANQTKLLKDTDKEYSKSEEYKKLEEQKQSRLTQLDTKLKTYLNKIEKLEDEKKIIDTKYPENTEEYKNEKRITLIIKINSIKTKKQLEEATQKLKIESWAIAKKNEIMLRVFLQKLLNLVTLQLFG